MDLSDIYNQLQNGTNDEDDEKSKAALKAGLQNLIGDEPPSEDAPDAIQPTSSPLEYAAGAAAGGAGTALAKGAMESAPEILGNEIGSIGPNIKQYPNIKAIGKNIKDAASYVLKPNGEDIMDAATQYGGGLIGKLKSILGTNEDVGLHTKAAKALQDGVEGVTPEMVQAATNRSQAPDVMRRARGLAQMPKLSSMSNKGYTGTGSND